MPSIVATNALAVTGPTPAGAHERIAQGQFGPHMAPRVGEAIGGPEGLRLAGVEQRPPMLSMVAGLPMCAPSADGERVDS